MMLKPDDLDFISNFDTVWAVILGAVLATLGGFAATQFEQLMGRRERERNAALLFGEVLSTLVLIIELAGDTRGRGDPYGPVTLRMLRSARRELDVYERNRERLFDLRNGALRARIHTLVLRLAMPLDGIFDATRELAELDARQGAAGTVLPPLRAQRSMLEDRRDSAFDFLIETAPQLDPVVTELEPLARHSFEGLGAIARSF